MPRHALPERTKAERRCEDVLHRIAAHHHAVQCKRPLVAACKRRIPDRRRAERRHDELLRRHAHIREPRRRENRRRPAEAVPREIELCRRMCAQLRRDYLTCRAVAVVRKRVRKERRLRIVKETSVHQRRRAPLRHGRITHREKLCGRRPTECHTTKAQIRPHIAPALRPWERDQMCLHTILRRAYEMKEPPDRPAMPRRFIRLDLPARRDQARAQQLRQIAAVCRLRCRRAHKVERRQVTGRGKCAQRGEKNAEKQQKSSEYHRRTSFLQKFIPMIPIFPRKYKDFCKIRTFGFCRLLPYAFSVRTHKAPVGNRTDGCFS